MNSNLINAVKRSCKKNINIRSILLHGSHAVGFANKYSDYDF